MRTHPNRTDRLILSVAIATYLGGLLAVGIVLPMRQGRDPIGTGRWLGLVAEPTLSPAVATTATAPTGPAATHTPAPAPFRTDRRAFTLAPGSGLEFKYRLDKGGAMIYSWSASAPVHYDFHGEPDGAREGYADDYEKGDSARSGNGLFVAPTTGIHGWYWENRGTAAVALSLDAAGFFATGIEFLPTGPVEHPIAPAR